MSRAEINRLQNEIQNLKNVVKTYFDTNDLKNTEACNELKRVKSELDEAKLTIGNIRTEVDAIKITKDIV